MRGIPKSVRNMKLNTDSGEDVKSTDLLKGEAKPSSTWKDKNSTEQYEEKGSGFDKKNLGGENTNS